MQPLPLSPSPSSRKRTLYLTRKTDPSSLDCRVTLDGPSLLVQQTARATRRYPLQFLRHVVIQGPVELPAAVLAACFRHGVLLSWHTLHGEPLGHLWPAREVPAPLSERLEQLWERQDWHWKYENWRRSEERRAIRDTLTLLGQRVHDLRPEAVRRLLRHLAGANLASSPRAWFLRFLRGALHTLVQENLARVGVSLESLGRRTTVAQLPDDLTELLLWRLYAELLREPPHWQDPTADSLRRAAITWIETRRAAQETRFLQILDRLDYFLGGLR